MTYNLRRLSVALSSLLCLLLLVTKAAAIPAFPGAEGEGANALGGRGGSVYYVTNLYDYTSSSDPNRFGTLRYGISSASGPRTILFKVSGTILLKANLTINKPYLTIAGQTAPGDGITLKRRLTSVQNTHDVIIRYLRCRAGDDDSTFQDDAFHVVNAQDIIADHISSSWSVDECTSVTWSTNVTIQWCMIAESLKNSQHDKGAHGYGTLLRYGDGSLTFHHNLYEHNDSRNPRLGDRIKLDFVNNVLYNWGGRAGYSGGNGATEDTKDNPGGVFTNHLNYVGNYLIAGPSSTTPNTAFASGATNTVIYQTGNRIDPNKNGMLDGTDTGWGMFNGYPYTASATRFPLSSVTTNTAADAYQMVLAFVGASQVRDEVDLRLISNVRNQKGRLVDAVGTNTQSGDYITNNINGTDFVFVRGWPDLASTEAPADADNDGIPDYWELAMGWNPSVANNNHVNGDGYTDLEYYLNWLADRHALGHRNGSFEINLRALTGQQTNFSYTLANGTNGTVSLQADGYTAEFNPAQDFNGLASFSFRATNAANQAGFGPITVSVLVSTTNAPAPPNTPPTLQSISDQNILAGRTLSFTNSASDTDVPAQAISYSLLNEPAGASVNPSNGVFAWRPSIAQAGSSNYMRIVATDNGSPNLSATQQFSVLVGVPSSPILSGTSVGGQLQLTVTGDTGPDYEILTSTNLIDWSSVLITNSPALPFVWSTEDSDPALQEFFRIQLKP